MTKMKTFVLLLSKRYAKGSPSEFKQTGFKRNLQNGRKIHAIKPNYDFWKKRIDEVNEGKAVLSIREWDGDPYRSKQTEIARLTAENGIGVQSLSLDDENSVWIDGKKVRTSEVTSYDCTSVEDFSYWVKNLNYPKTMAVIHFTGFRY